ncbi:FtsX-like permease family protein [Amycolatopsis nigrescens]|uniref:FtsX-like permease family protein n=1 Tax=Amycolatopsis nigrescens TaxID=381445 RepID=UPI000375F665|nr:ABC transporter permease [Amycolatopsis nigrescens]
MNALKLAVRVLRVDRRTRTSAILTTVGVAVATGLVLLLVSLPFATQVRAQRALWQEPSYAGGQEQASLLLAASTDYSGGQKIVRVDVAAVGDSSTVELPPGVPKLPAPGEALVSPELGELMHRLPAAQLGDRFGGDLAGALGQDALKFPEQLVALVGHTPEDMPANASPMRGFTTGTASPDSELQLLAGVGVVVLLVPSLVLVASSARLTAARRERRLAALRLAGATPGQVTGMVAAETAISSVAGTLLGFALSPVLHGLATLVPWDGGTWQSTDFALPPVLTAVIVAAMPVLVVLAGVLGLRRVLSNPLIASGGHTRKPLHWWRLLALPVAGLFFLYAVTSSGDSGGLMMVLLGLVLVVGAAAVVGPWLTSAVGGSFVRGWRRPSGLLAGRRLRDDPRGAYRASAGVVLAVFTGSMALTLLPSLEALAGGGRSYQDSVLYADTDPEHAATMVGQANDGLAKYGQSVRAVEIPKVMLTAPSGSSQQALVLDCAKAAELTRFVLAGSCTGAPGVYGTYAVDLNEVKVSGTGAPGDPAMPFAAGTPMTVVRADADLAGSGSLLIDPAALPPGVQPERSTVAVQTTDANREVVRTALVGAAAGEQVESRELTLDSQQTQLADLRRVTVIGLVAAAILAGCSAAVATAGSVMDRRRTFGALIAAGTPVKVLARALRTEAAMPAMVATVGAGVAGTLVGLGLFSLVNEGSVVLSPWILAPVVLGIGVAVLAASVCTPALNRVRAEPLADE